MEKIIGDKNLDKDDILLWLFFPIMLIDIIIHGDKWDDFYADDPMSLPN